MIPPKANAPFSLLLQTEWVKTLPDGGTITSKNQRRIARDTSGRIYQERWFLVPKNGKIKSQMTTIQISDPSAHTLYNCFMLDGMNLISKRSDPRIGTQTFTATNLILSEPDPKLFDLPEGFRVVDRRQLLPLEN